MRKQEEVQMATQDSPSLHERLGGVYSIATVVDDLIDRVMTDQRLNANPLVDDAHHEVPPAGFKYLRITPGEWDAFMDDVAQTLDKFAVRRPSGPRSWPSSRAPGARSSPPNKRRLAGRRM